MGACQRLPLGPVRVPGNIGQDRVAGGGARRERDGRVDTSAASLNDGVRGGNAHALSKVESRNSRNSETVPMQPLVIV